MEHEILKKMRQIIGFEHGDSILAPGLYIHLTQTLLGTLTLFFIFTLGGAISNLYAVIVARQKKFPEVKTKGLKALPQLVLFTSEHVS